MSHGSGHREVVPIRAGADLRVATLGTLTNPVGMQPGVSIGAHTGGSGSLLSTGCLEGDEQSGTLHGLQEGWVDRNGH